jgi:hypothetical protein
MCSSNNHREVHLWLGLVAFVVGAVLLLQQFDLVPAETWNYLWPAILIVTGLKWMMMSSSKGMGMSGCECGMDSCDECGDNCEVPMPAPKASSKKKGKK